MATSREFSERVEARSRPRLQPIDGDLRRFGHSWPRVPHVKAGASRSIRISAPRRLGLALDIQRMYSRPVPRSTAKTPNGKRPKAAKASAKSSKKTKAARTAPVKGRRLSLRVEDKDRALFDRAADANRETLTQFLVAGGRERAERLLADRTQFQLSPDAWEELVAIMDREPRPNPQLARLFSRRSPA